jgi:2-dehydro-3-deoxyphosphogluconate aldolase/(4S)-4-hydroxy-2-oxoglutarate aldolase
MKSQFPEMLLQQVENPGVVAVLVIDDAAHAVPVARALLAGGITAMELTLRTPAAIDALGRIRGEVPEILAGIGTVLTIEQVQAVFEAGGQFAVAPGTNCRVIQAAQQVGLPFAPGIATPSDLETALELGCREVKFFPAEPSGGLSYLRSIAAPYAHLGVRYIPLGGVNVDNLGAYLAEPMVLAVGGSWLATRDMIKNQDWQGIRQRAAEATTHALQARTIS